MLGWSNRNADGTAEARQARNFVDGPRLGSYAGVDKEKLIKINRRKTVKRFLISLAMCAVFAATVMAQDASSAPATKEDVERYLSVTHSHEMLNQMMAAMAKPMHQRVHEEYLKDKDKLPADYEERTNKEMDDMFQNMPWDEIIQAMVPVYQKHLTKGDVDALVAFYSSPTGAKMLREMPAIMGEAMQSMMPIMQKHMATVKDRIDQETAAALKESEKKAN
jgi:hypothetical protein